MPYDAASARSSATDNGNRSAVPCCRHDVHLPRWSDACYGCSDIGGPNDPCSYKNHLLSPEQVTIFKDGQATFQVHGVLAPRNRRVQPPVLTIGRAAADEA